MAWNILFNYVITKSDNTTVNLGRWLHSQHKLYKSNKLIKLTVDFGSETRTVVTNIKPLLNPLDEFVLIKLRITLGMSLSLVDKSFAFITNLKPVVMMGIESTAMIMPGELDNGTPTFVVNSNTGNKML